MISVAADDDGADNDADNQKGKFDPSQLHGIVCH